MIVFFRMFITCLSFFALYIHCNAQNSTTLDTTLGIGGFNGTVVVVRAQSDGKTLVGGSFSFFKTYAANSILRFNSDGSVDKTFNPGTGAIESTITSIAIQADNKIILAGNFTSFNGIPKRNIVRLNANGSIDNTFDTGTGYTDYGLETVVLQPDGKILAGGGFTYINGSNKNRMVRFNTDGSIDNTFDIGIGFNYTVKKITLQADGKILTSGSYTQFNNIDQHNLTRLNTNGTLDTTFNIGAGFMYPLNVIEMQSDGKILVNGGNGILRLNSDGSQDNSFNYPPNLTLAVTAILVLSDGKILAGSQFLQYNSSVFPALVRINADGSNDNSFTNGFGNTGIITSLLSLPNGKILTAGTFKDVLGIGSTNILILNSNGSIDLATSPSFNGSGYSISKTLLQADGKLLVLRGTSSLFNGIYLPPLIRLHRDWSVDLGFNPLTTIVAIHGIQLDGKIIASNNYNLVRLYPNGTIDPSFVVSGANITGSSSAFLLSSGKIIVTGNINNKAIARLNADGSLDNTFNAPFNFQIIYKVTEQKDGKLIIASSDVKTVCRLQENGSIDNSFNMGSGNTDGTVRNLILQQDGKIIATGLFNYFNGEHIYNVVRLNSNGSMDLTFDIGKPSQYNAGANYRVNSMVMQSDGKIILGGQIIFDGQDKHGLIRLNSNGSIDNTFITGTGISEFGSVNSIVLNKDGSLIIAGDFSTWNKISVNNIFKLRGDPVLVNFNAIAGAIYQDNISNCYFESTEPALNAVLVKAIPGVFYGSSDINGYYKIETDTGTATYTLLQEYNSIQSKTLLNQCIPSYNVQMKGSLKDTCCFNFANSVKSCALLNVSIQSTRMRRCYRSNTFINYCNYGGAASSGTELKVYYPEHVIPITSIPMWSSKTGNVLTYDLGTVANYFCGRIVLTDSVICGDEAIRGLTECIKASIYPISQCVPENAAWDRSSINVTVVCENGETRFTILNEGSGNMSTSQTYRVYENDTLIYNGSYMLNKNSYFTVSYPSNGQTILLEADQHPAHPGNSRPRAVIENCGVSSTKVRNLITTMALDDLDEQVAITCKTIVDSYDPNDKSALPVGRGPFHNISSDEEIEYTIGFQNTGSDTAYTIVVVDTLDQSLDPASITQASSSHPYKFRISGKDRAVLTYTFYNINLPDSSTNKTDSHGIISFRIKAFSNQPQGTTILNKAYIHFDYNSPIITNETIHTINDNIPINFDKGLGIKEGDIITSLKTDHSDHIRLYPNPSTGSVTIELKQYNKASKLVINSLLGITKESIELNNSFTQEVVFRKLEPGIYIYELFQEGETQSSGLLKIE